MNKKALRISIVLLAVAVIGIWLWHDHRRQAAGGDLKLYGNVDMREVALAFNGSERVARMLVEEGDRVHKGQLLAELTTTGLQALVDRATAQLEAQQAVVDRMLAGSRPEDIRKARADLAAAQAQAEDAARTYQRLRKLSTQDLASKEQTDNAGAAAKAARERVKAATEVLRLAEQGPRQEDIAAAKAELKADQAQLELAKYGLTNASLLAPADGIIRNRILEPGDMATPQRPAYTLAMTDPLWVRAYVPERDLGRVRPGMRAEVETDSFPGKRYRGWVGYISPTAEFTPQSVQTEELRTQLVYQLRVFVCNPEGELRLGMPATVIIPLDQPQAMAPKADGGNNPCQEH
ncbi:MAG TPA: efflux RND transporter periplasmic adaptor subunit [Mariprofundaceae bacterium]|nr:efflux RND transporter periplasmic adaptor subunit [Mariprofundaceae bacterium]